MGIYVRQIDSETRAAYQVQLKDVPFLRASLPGDYFSDDPFPDLEIRPSAVNPNP